MTALPRLQCRACRGPLDAKAARSADPKNPLCSNCLVRTVTAGSLKVGMPTDPATRAAIDRDLEARLESQGERAKAYAADDRAWDRRQERAEQPGNGPLAPWGEDTTGEGF